MENKNPQDTADIAEAQAESADERAEATQAEPKPKKSKPKKPRGVTIDTEALKSGKPEKSRIVTIGPKEYDKVVLPADENDPHWDPKMKLPVPEGLVNGLAEFGWDESMLLAAVETKDHKYKIVNGRTRWRALAKANALRKKAGLEPIVAHLAVVKEQDDIEGVVRDLRRGVRLNSHVQEIDPMTKAESIVRALSAGIEEKTVADDHAITVNDLHGYLLLTDEDKCPPSVQELLREGKISFAAALELARKADKMTKAEINALADQIAKVAGGGVKVTTGTIKKAAGDGDGPATQKQKKQFILDLQSGDLPGKFGEYVKWAAIVAMEVGLGTRTIKSAEDALGKIAKGHTVRIDFKQYQVDGKTAPSEPVKGQK